MEAGCHIFGPDIQADVINFDDLIKNFVFRKSRRKNFSNIIKVGLYKNKHYFPSCKKPNFILHNCLYFELNILLYMWALRSFRVSK